MKLNNFGKYLVAILAGASFLNLLGCAGMQNSFQSSNADIPKQMLSRQILVTLPESLKSNWDSIKTELARNNAIEESGEFPLSSIGVDCLVYKVPQQQSLEQTIQTLKADNRVVLVQENQVFAGIQGGESDELAALSYGPQSIHADAAHQFVTGKGVKVAVIDTGAEKNHPDLKDRIQQTVNFVEGGDRSFSRDQHGTAVTGVIGARADDGIGIYGIAPEADISVYKACWYPETSGAKAQCSSWTLAKALDAAINQGAQVINLSLAGPDDELMRKLLETAHKRGISVVSATLEDQVEPGFPANLPMTVPVLSSDPKGKTVAPSWLAKFPQTIAAPGVDIITTVPKESYDFVSGSSLATAHVSGIIALLLELKPELTPDEIKKLLHRNGGNQSANTLSNLDICAIIKDLRNGDGC